MPHVRNSMVKVPGVVSPKPFDGGRDISPSRKGGQLAFDEILQHQIVHERDRLHFSGHALQRISQRNVVISQEDLEKIRSGVKAARDKGARETLLVYKDHAFVVSVENRTVITARPMNDLSVYTKIDSAVIIGRRERPV